MPITNALPDMKRELSFFSCRKSESQEINNSTNSAFQPERVPFPTRRFHSGRSEKKPEIF